MKASESNLPLQPSQIIHVLLVDDHEALRQGLKAMLETESDIRVLGEAENGLEAVRMADELHPDLILMDVSMPVMNGLEATRQILQTHPDMRILLLSAYNDPGYIQQAKTLGAAGYLIKQTSLSLLAEVIRDVHRGSVFILKRNAECL